MTAKRIDRWVAWMTPALLAWALALCFLAPHHPIRWAVTKALATVKAAFPSGVSSLTTPGKIVCSDTAPVGHHEIVGAPLRRTSMLLENDGLCLKAGPDGQPFWGSCTARDGDTLCYVDASREWAPCSVVSEIAPLAKGNAVTGSHTFSTGTVSVGTIGSGGSITSISYGSPGTMLSGTVMDDATVANGHVLVTSGTAWVPIERTKPNNERASHKRPLFDRRRPVIRSEHEAPDHRSVERGAARDVSKWISADDWLIVDPQLRSADASLLHLGR